MPNWTKERQITLLKYILVGIALIVSTLLGLNYPEFDVDEIVPLGTTNFDVVQLGNGSYALGHTNSGLEAIHGTKLITGTGTVAHGLTTVSWALCTLAEDPTAGAGDGAMCTVTVSGSTVTLKVWQDDFVTAATEADVDVNWLVIGTP